MKVSCIIVLALFSVSCETTVTDSDWPEHDPKLVVQALLQLGKDSAYVRCTLSRTHGLGEQYSRDSEWVNDVEVHLTIDGATLSIPRSQPDILPVHASVVPRSTRAEYTLTVSRGTLTARGTVHVPELPLRLDTVWTYTDLDLSSGFSRRTCHFVLATPVRRMWYDIRFEEELPDGGWSTAAGHSAQASPTGSISNVVSYRSRNGMKIRYSIVARAPEYHDYHDANHNRDYSGSPFDPYVKNPLFNITGDGIGFFWYEIVGEPVEISH